jgi:hypothetical protein
VFGDYGLIDGERGRAKKKKSEKIRNPPPFQGGVRGGLPARGKNVSINKNVNPKYYLTTCFS